MTVGAGGLQGGQRLNGRTEAATGTLTAVGGCEWYMRCAQPGRIDRSWEAGRRGRQVAVTVL